MSDPQTLARYDAGYKLCKHLEQLLEDVSRDTHLPGPEAERLRQNAPRVAEQLAKARRSLANPVFKIAMVGGFSGGKSTLVNELLGRELLAESVNPETANVTAIRRVPASQPEKVVLNYLTDEEIKQCLNSFCDTLGLDPSLERTRLLAAARQAQTKVADELTKGAHERRKQLEDLISFLSSCIQNSSLIGLQEEHSFSCDLVKAWSTKNSGKTSEQLSLIREIELRIHSDVLTDHSVLIDLPGTDSTRPRDRRIAEDYLQTVDAVIVTSLFKRPLSEADTDIIGLLRNQKAKIQDKLFFTLAQFDTAKGKEVEELPATYRQVLDSIDRIFSIGKPQFIYLTSAYIHRRLRRRKSGISLTPEEEGELSAFTSQGDRFRQGGAARVDGDLKRLLEQYYVDGGLGALRSQLLDYFQKDCLRIKLDDALEKLDRTWETLQKVVGPGFEKARLERETVRVRAILSGVRISKACMEHVRNVADDVRLEELSVEKCEAEFKKLVIEEMSRPATPQHPESAGRIEKVVRALPIKRQLAANQGTARRKIAEEASEAIEGQYLELLDKFMEHVVFDPLLRRLADEPVKGVDHSGTDQTVSLDGAAERLFVADSGPMRQFHAAKAEYRNSTKVCLQARADEETRKLKSDVPEIKAQSGPILPETISRYTDELINFFKFRYNALSDTLRPRLRDYILYCLDIFTGRLARLFEIEARDDAAAALNLDGLLPGVVSGDMTRLEGYNESLNRVRASLLQLRANSSIA
jgi:GTPase SAR1 family protein